MDSPEDPILVEVKMFDVSSGGNSLSLLIGERMGGSLLITKFGEEKFILFSSNSQIDERDLCSFTTPVSIRFGVGGDWNFSSHMDDAFSLNLFIFAIPGTGGVGGVLYFEPRPLAKISIFFSLIFSIVS